MGLINKEDNAKPEAEEDTPVVKQLKELDDKYMVIEKEFQAAAMKLQVEYAKKQQPMLEERKKMLQVGDAKTGTPALSGFWLKALKNHPEIAESIESHDEPVLEYLSDIMRVDLDENDLEKGFKLIFTFAENPYFTNTVIEKEHIMGTTDPFNGDRSCASVKTTEIDWNEGKNVTVELVTKKVKGGGAKKAKAKKAKEEPRASFFRDYFRSLFPGCPLLGDLKARMMGMMEEDDDEDDEEDESMLEYLLEEDLDKGNSLTDYIIPYATHWWTGEAVPEGFEADSDDDDDDDDDDDEDSEDEEEPLPKPPTKGGKKAAGKASAKNSGEAPDEKKQEECKQQ